MYEQRDDNPDNVDSLPAQCQSSIEQETFQSVPGTLPSTLLQMWTLTEAS